MSDVILDLLRPQPTGGTIVTFKPGTDTGHQMATLENSAGKGAASISATSMEAMIEPSSSVPAVLIEEIGLAVISETVDAAAAMSILSSDDTIAEARPEFWMFDMQAFQDTGDRTWGIAATLANTSPQSGTGVKLAVLDTGLDFDHPDFAGRHVVQQSFVPGEAAQDGQGHGTHCCGTAAGRQVTPGVPRYGVAPDAELHVGKVLNNQGSGRERDILSGMLWAIRSGCAVISMSLGRPVRPGERPSLSYERMGQLALDSGSLIIAAAGNDSQRQFGFIAPVGAPANSRSIMAVAALDQSLGIADFSCGGINPDGGEVDISGPGVEVFSTWPRPRNYRVLQGTSMACPHVAGVAALWAASDPTLRGTSLWQKLTGTARSLPLPARDVGAGLVQAPQEEKPGKYESDWLLS
ncbi:MAG: S8 family peptidase [Marinibacterium sp.]